MSEATTSTAAAPPVQKDDPVPPGGQDGAAGDGSASTDGAGSGALQLQAQVKDALLGELAKAGEALITLANTVKDANVTDQPVDPPVPTDVLSAIGEIASKLSAIASSYGSGAGAKSGAPGDMSTAPLDMNDAEKAALTKAVALVKSELGCDDGRAHAICGVQKVGRRMAKERLERFRKAIDLLASIMKEISVENARKSAGAPVVPGGSVVITLSQYQAIEQSLAGVVDTVKTLTEKVTKSDAVASTAKAELVKAQGEIARLSKGVAGPNSALREAPPEPAKKVHWPQDLAPKTIASAPRSSHNR